ncbi:hypothetical protein CVS28_16775 [Arthrobacter glacialis]|uniref:Uncharacterized protein n=1 Tax=Arthrobacter glacialis TaxID=1664 RepID=A0A2S3ZT94_ARTGL|nr:hypothetical protein CVS28_16775 [Arthrobacter glacialis]POH72393.1 hypothetical protein CVS27_16025 [Arthrobacter glacialis]
MVVILVAAVAYVYFVDLPLGAKFVILAWPVSSVAINERQLHKQRAAAAEQAARATRSLPDQVLHAYRERT